MKQNISPKHRYLPIKSAISHPRRYAPSSDIIRVIKSRRMRWAGNVACMGEKRGAYRILVGNLTEGDHLGDPGVDRRIILKCIFKKWDEAWTGLSWLRIVTGGGLL
jgi:hypothetical protein